MTSLATPTDALLERIHATGYWRVLLHPSQYDEHRIPTLKACEDLIEATKVSLRGWDYPHFRRYTEDTIRGDNWIQHAVDCANHIELWRFFQSGQFVHHLAF